MAMASLMNTGATTKKHPLICGVVSQQVHQFVVVGQSLHFLKSVPDAHIRGHPCFIMET